MSKKRRNTKSRQELQIENDFLRRQRKASAWSPVVSHLIVGATVGFCFWRASLAVIALTGQTTLADIDVNLLGKLNVSFALSWAVGGCGVLYGIKQRRLRRDAIARLEGRNKEIEKHHDSKRTSSGLTPTGETHPEDI